MKAQSHAGLLAALALAALAAACGPTLPPPDLPPAPTAAPAATGPAIAAPSATAVATPAGPVASAAPAAPGAPPSGPPSVPLKASAMLDDLKKAGVDLTVADLDKMPLAAKKKVMPFFQKALGYAACTGCHVEGDFRKETRNMKVALGMWKSFVAPLRDAKGGAVFCDSCHDGKSQLLNRADKAAVKKFMASDYEGKLTRADKKDHECSTCHGDTFELKIIEKLWGVPKGS